MKKIIAAVMVFLPHMLFAATDCRVMEYPDHYLAECLGDEKAGTAPLPALVKPQQAAVATHHGAGKKPESPTSTISSVQKEAEQLQQEAPEQQHPGLSKRNRAKIEAEQMKEMKRKAQSAVAQ